MASKQSAKPQSSDTRRAGSRWVRAFIVVGFILVVLAAYRLYDTLSEVGLTGLNPFGASNAARSHVHLRDQPVYKIKKKQELLGVNVIRIISKQQPEEFLVLDGVSRKLVDRIYGKKPDLVWANMMANQLLKLRQPGEGDASPISVEVQSIKTLASGEMTHEKQKVPYWQLEVKFKLSNESEPRFYEAGIVRDAGKQEDPPGDRDTVVVGYAQKEAFQKELVADLLDHLSFEQN